MNHCLNAPQIFPYREPPIFLMLGDKFSFQLRIACPLRCIPKASGIAMVPRIIRERFGPLMQPSLKFLKVLAVVVKSAAIIMPGTYWAGCIISWDAALPIRTSPGAAPVGCVIFAVIRFRFATDLADSTIWLPPLNLGWLFNLGNLNHTRPPQPSWGFHRSQ